MDVTRNESDANTGRASKTPRSPSQNNAIPNSWHSTVLGMHFVSFGLMDGEERGRDCSAMEGVNRGKELSWASASRQRGRSFVSPTIFICPGLAAQNLHKSRPHRRR
ncbi:hypothetical protein AcW1_007806 [Taiwanofungus camphoratus]|nr:hypothetical protein AcW2_007138 [Antrodia cinnamomea]KAI0926781.1 hypothetical protein AcV5_007476 [Antrodia cinnamomea]KAI0953634.1 hypothetical protein AcW1_007806 [Antrodia cinnamomea]